MNKFVRQQGRSWLFRAALQDTIYVGRGHGTTPGHREGKRLLETSGEKRRRREIRHCLETLGFEGGYREIGHFHCSLHLNAIPNSSFPHNK
ncbi:hypothetical protein VNO78_24702 [Psophocarpus tetragonolobus]|uniref:Uncharacterized protein n=1 Tax=Psophocarpus tetragonolobus TaxID=3891 RepID=A0AAN9S607_PSOTE